ncbi:hypothetical protein AC578_5935 [Pseudocercospora eumusae]|uniref:Uncharacterized protein n=1 Tax=Pseudocercospora eumusae TaxID=321146 RepID=A0A139HI61_9PEZI|nr:hypothetical protein AC578_5935 [Pseudocercospora eumusae]
MPHTWRYVLGCPDKLVAEFAAYRKHTTDHKALKRVRIQERSGCILSDPFERVPGIILGKWKLVLRT